MAHFIPLGHPYTAITVAQASFDNIVRLHGFPCSIVSDRDPVFTSTLWSEMFNLAGVKLRLSSAFRPQTDGQSELRKWPTVCSLSISDAYLVIAPAVGCAGYLGLSTASTLLSGQLWVLPHLSWFMAVHHRL
jgi:hypothetical protein